ncbi:MAG: hypothetical protein FWE61_08385, partial [Micrococcales bacterium]|nr:hypothetical protein [Micrococcales bacterium]
MAHLVVQVLVVQVLVVQVLVVGVPVGRVRRQVLALVPLRRTAPSGGLAVRPVVPTAPILRRQSGRLDRVQEEQATLLTAPGRQSVLPGMALGEQAARPPTPVLVGQV